MPDVRALASQQTTFVAHGPATEMKKKCAQKDSTCSFRSAEVDNGGDDEIRCDLVAPESVPTVALAGVLTD